MTGLCLIAPASRYDDGVSAQTEERPRLSVKPAPDFEVTGTGEHAAWQQAEWTALRRRQPDGHPYDSRFKVLYSNTGLYFLMDGTDRKLTATMNEDFMDLWNEDVFEVFLWTDERYPVYFEYEISPLNRELPILIPNFGGQFLGWRPWHYEGDRQTRKATTTTGGPKQSQAAIQGWRAEFFIPYALLTTAAERAAEAGHALARQLLPHGPRRRAEHAVGVGAGRQELPRVREVRRSGVRGALSRSAVRGRDLVNSHNRCYDRVFRTSVRAAQYAFVSPSSRGPGRRPFTPVTRVRIPLGTSNLRTMPPSNGLTVPFPENL